MVFFSVYKTKTYKQTKPNQKTPTKTTPKPNKKPQQKPETHKPRNKQKNPKPQPNQSDTMEFVTASSSRCLYTLLLNIISAHLLGLNLNSCLEVSRLAPGMLSKYNVWPVNSPIWLMLLNV